METTMEGAATALGVSLDTVRRRVKKGTLESRKEADGRVVVILPDDLAATPSAPMPPSMPAIDADEVARLRGEMEQARADLTATATSLDDARRQIDAMRAMASTQDRAAHDLKVELAAVQAVLEESRRRAEELAAIVAHQQHQIDEATTAQAELRRLLAQAQAQVSGLVSMLPAPPAPAALTSGTDADGPADTPEQSRPWWKFW